jgi:hypothetical protein
MGFLSSIGVKIGLYAAIGAALVGVWLYIGKLHADVAAAQARVSEVTQINQQSAKDIAAYKAQVAQANAIEQALGAKLQASATAERAEEARYAALAAKPGEDAPDAPVVSAYFDEMRGQK